MFHRAICLLLALASFAGAQSAEPATNSLDSVQQVFPAEAARVIAWLRNSKGDKIADVLATMEGPKSGGYSWKVLWRDAAGKVIRERQIEAGPARIGEGPAFYRDVFAQLTGEDWKIQSTSPDNSSTAFWQGAELAGVSRTEAITSAGKLIGEKPRMERAADAARLAGVLIHGAVPSVAGFRSIDARLLARGAAWLCVSEKRLNEPLTAAWAPVLFLAGREAEAGELWKSPDAAVKLRTSAERFWAVALAETSVQDSFTFAARKENRAWAIPAMFLCLRKGARLKAPFEEICASFDREFVNRFHDYAPMVSERAVADAAWQRLREEYASQATEPGRGKLTPVAHVNAGDLTPGNVTGPEFAAKGTLPDLNEEQLATLAKTVLAAAASAPPQTAAADPARTKSMARQRLALDNPPALTTADETWSYLEKLRLGPGFADSPEDGMLRMRTWLEQQRSVSRQFATKYPDDPRRWEALTIGIEAAIRQKEFDNGYGREQCVKTLDEIIEAPTAAREVKGTAAFLRVVLGLSEVNGNSRFTLPPFHRKLSEFLEAYPEHPRAVDAAALQIQLLQQGETPGADKILENLSRHSNQQIAAQAKAYLEERARFAELKKKPIELKFTAADGKTVDLAKMRGKVVLLDFWASWCGPCMAEAPNVVAVYRKLHDRGFEIVGISLDQDKAAMDSAIQRAGLNWPHAFDGKGWQNEIAQRFGIRSIPATWLFDKQGKLHKVGLRGAELEPTVVSLLRE